MNPQYSEKELKLIEQLGYMDLPSVEPIVLYRIMAMNLFKQNETGVLVDSVRRCPFSCIIHSYTQKHYGKLEKTY